MSESVTLFEKLKKILEQAEVDYTKATVKGNKAAGTRVRKAMQQLRAGAKDVRAQMMELRSAPKPTQTPAS